MLCIRPTILHDMLPLAQVHLCPPQNVSKGNAVDRILERLIKSNHTPDFVLVVGDDRSDEDMFTAIEHVHFSPHVPAEVRVWGLSLALWRNGHLACPLCPSHACRGHPPWECLWGNCLGWGGCWCDCMSLLASQDSCTAYASASPKAEVSAQRPSVGHSHSMCRHVMRMNVSAAFCRPAGAFEDTPFKGLSVPGEHADRGLHPVACGWVHSRAKRFRCQLHSLTSSEILPVADLEQGMTPLMACIVR